MRDWNEPRSTRPCAAMSIAPLSKRKEQAIIAALNARKAVEALRPSSPFVTGAASFATVALKNNGKVQKIAALAARHNGVNGAFWNAVEHNRSITASERDKLKNYAAVSEHHRRRSRAASTDSGAPNPARREGHPRGAHHDQAHRIV